MSLDYFSTIENNSKVYRVIFNKISDNLITSNNNKQDLLFNTLFTQISERDAINSISDISSFKSDLLELYKNPPDINQWLFIFIGKVDNSSIKEDLSKIMTEKSFDNITNNLDSFFGYNVREEWKISDNYEKIFFIDSIIHREDNINYLYLLISSLLTKFTNENEIDEPIIADSRSILLHSDNLSNKNNKIKEIISSILYEFKKKNYQFNIHYLKKTLETFNIPNNILDIIIEKYDNDINNINYILNNEIIVFFIEIYLSFSPLLHTVYQKNSMMPITTYIPYYFSNKKLEDLSDKKLRVIYNKSKNLIKNLTNSNTIYFYSLNNFLNNIPSENYTDSYNNYLKILFPKTLLEEYNTLLTNYSDNEYINNNISSIANTLDEFLDINELFYKYTRNNDTPLSVRFSNSYIVSLNYKFKFPINFELRYIFNDLKLSFDVPFSKYRDIQSKDVLYKIFKPITKRDGIQYLPEVEKEELYDWIKYKNFEIDNYKVKNIRGYPKELFFKLKLFDFYLTDYLLNNGEIVKINNYNEKVFLDIKYNEIIYKNIESNYVTKLGEDGQLRLGDLVNFYNKKTIYADIEIFKRGITTVNINTTYLKDMKFNNALFMDKILSRINFFIAKVYNCNRILLSYKNIATPLDSNLLISSSPLNYPKFNFNFKIEVNNNIDYSYNLLTKIFKNLYPLVHLQTENLQKKDIIEYYDEDLSNKLNTNIWIKGIIKDISKEGLFTLELHDDSFSEYKGYVTKENIINLLIRKEGLDRTYIKLLFKKVVDFEESKPLKNFIIKSLELGIEQSEIIDRITERFSKTTDEAKKELLNITRESVIENLTRITTPIITIDYMNRISNISNNYIANILVENVSDYVTANLILKFIEFSFDIYNLLNPKGFNNPYLENLKQTEFASKQVDTTIVDQVLIPDDSELQGSPSNKEMENLFDMDFEYEDSDSEEEDDDDDDEDDEIDDLVEKNLDLESITITKSNINKNVILERLYETDPNLFFWESNDSDKTRYSRTCQSVDRYPKVFTDEKKKQIDERDRLHFESLSGDWGPNPSSYSTRKNDNKNCNNISDIKQMKKYNCSAVKYGSDSNKFNWKHWYTCPRIYDMYENVPLHYTMLNYNHPTIEGNFIPLDYEDITKWRTHIDGKTDILDFNPTYKSRGVITDSNKIFPTRRKSLILLPASSEYSYPGFMNGTKHPEGLFSPCCYKNTNKNILSAFGISKVSNQVYNSYIQGVNKELGYSPRRIGVVPKEILTLLGTLNSKCITGDMTHEKKCFFRFGNKQGNDSFLNIVSDLYRGPRDPSLDNRRIKNYIVDNLSLNKFKTINNGLLEIYFRNYGKQSSLQNFIEYTLSDEYKDYKFFYELFFEKSDNLIRLSNNKINGLILIIFDIKYTKNNSKPEINILSPYFSPNIIKNLNIIDKVAFVIKKGHSFEPVYYFDGNNIPKKIFDINHNKHIENLVNTFKQKNIFSIQIESNSVRVARHLNLNRFDRKYRFRDVIQILYNCKKENWKNEYNLLRYNTENGYSLLIDINNRIFGILLDNNTIIPIYPEVISEQLLNAYNKRLFKMVKKEISKIDYPKTTLDKHLQVYSLLKKLTKNSKVKIDIVPVKFFVDSDGNTNGFLTNIGIYIDIITENKNLGTNKLGVVNYSNVDKAINMYENMQFKNSFVSPIELSYLNNILENLDSSTKNKFSFSGYYKKGDSIYLLETNNVFIPIVDIIESEFLSVKDNLDSVFQNINLVNRVPTISNLNIYQKQSSYLAKISEYKIPLNIAGTIMNNENKNIEKIFLETGTEINLENSFKINAIYNGNYIINDLISYNIEEKINKNTANKNITYSLRESVIDKINYDAEIYNAIRFMLYNLLQKNSFTHIKIFLEKIISSIDLSISTKRKIIYPFFDILYKLIINPIEKAGDSYPIINIDNLGDLDKCLGELYNKFTVDEIEKIDFNEFIWLTYSLINKKILDIDWLKTLLFQKKIITNIDDNVNLKNLFLDNIIENIGDLEKSYLLSAITSYNLLSDQIPSQICKLNVIDESNRISYIKYRIIEEVLRNSYTKSQIFDNFKQLNLDEKFRFNIETEILVSEKELKDKNILNNLYIVLKKNYYRNITTFDEMEYKINTDLLANQSRTTRDSIDRCIVGKIYNHHIVFTLKEKSIKNNNIKTNIVNLNRIQHRKLLVTIMNLNSNLTKKTIGSKANHKFKCIKIEKSLNR